MASEAGLLDAHFGPETGSRWSTGAIGSRTSSSIAGLTNSPGALRGFGVRQGDRVAVLLPNCAAFLETMFATAKLGAAFVPINIRMAAPKVTYLLADSGADVFVWSAQLSPLARAALAGEGVRVRARLIVGGRPTGAEAEFEEVLASGEPKATGISVAGNDLCCLMAAAGATGRPKRPC
ncbi:hypothetical protein B1987_04800 [Mycobacterium kansasii]|uniref:Long-chain-fatty-acid--CoA ligase FadD13 n=1 Tax=Mycobacterium attenuatum TaxID=2341086 RepID=A0A498Q6F3_9MYCO|nr:AMP-binding protein [Mycobacterium attenuatum]ORB83263.1 hypothetical protein B1987_04800 [Mycobacterium kansasii]VBA40917.1 Long-chain-fatty-acid--CoA ligase FadD13 [Mycobacterium attenuatum]VBA56774.1 Long-chain-fatty-acid--CoA ligase FadD13 [Mycobacterium attenuatum]VBA60168.1 Long-chain-fatty-acid--CoA ligase FadD13 [Mycobacterium attenuatum]